MKEKIEFTKNERIANKLYYGLRVMAFLSFTMLFFPSLNPGKITDLINKNVSLFTAGISYKTLIAECTNAFSKGWAQESTFVLLFFSSMIICIGIFLMAANACMSLGNNKLRVFGGWCGIAGGAVQLLGLLGIYAAYTQIILTNKPNKVMPSFSNGFYYFLTAALIAFLLNIVIMLLLPKSKKGTKFSMEPKFRLFLMFLPFAILAFVFCYLPLWGWRYAFFNYKSGGTLSKDNFVGLKWFTQLFQSAATRDDILRVMRNTLIMSGLGIATSWCAMAFAILLTEIKNKYFRKVVQMFTTIPNFISWVLVYAIAFAIFSSDGFINNFLVNLGLIESTSNYLMSESMTWVKMLAWGMWKGIGWSAIIYIAAISGIDQQLYEAATVDGAGRFQKIWHITVPGLLPTYCVLLLLSIAGVLSNGMEQYLVFENAINSEQIEVLDLYVYKIGINKGMIPLSTVVGMAKTIISVALLFIANGVSKKIRGESIV